MASANAMKKQEERLDESGLQEAVCELRPSRDTSLAIEDVMNTLNACVMNLIGDYCEL